MQECQILTDSLSYNECSVLQWVTLGSLIANWRHSSLMSFIGWMCQRWLVTSWVSWCIAVFTVMHLGTSPTISSQLGIMMYRCLHGHASRYLADHLITASDIASWLRLCSANWHQLIVFRCRLNTYGRRAFLIAAPTVWNSLPDELRDPAHSPDSFKQFLKIRFLFSLY